MVCIDSDVLIDFLRNKSYAVNLIKKLKETEEQLTTTSINSFELFKGEDSFSKLTKEKINKFLQNFEILNFDSDSSQIAGDIYNSLKKEGILLEIPDIIIASIAISNKEKLLTNNFKHFERIKELQLFLL